MLPFFSTSSRFAFDSLLKQEHAMLVVYGLQAILQSAQIRVSPLSCLLRKPYRSESGA